MGMQAELRWLDDPEIFRVNQLPAHSDHAYYESMEAYECGKSHLKQFLNGERMWSRSITLVRAGIFSIPS